MADLKNWQGLWLPAKETHLTAWMDKVQQKEDGLPCYQKSKLDFALSLVQDFSVAIDIGAHCGLHSMRMTKRFKLVHAFEPVELHREAFALNVTGNAILHAMALGEENGSVSMKSDPYSSGDTVVSGEGSIPLRRLDEVLPNVTGVGFIKLDCEGYELYALKGGEELLMRNKPVIMVEQKPKKAQQFGLPEIGAVAYLEGLGFRVAKEQSGDYFMTWYA